MNKKTDESDMEILRAAAKRARIDSANQLLKLNPANKLLPGGSDDVAEPVHVDAAEQLRDARKRHDERVLTENKARQIPRRMK